MTRSCAPSTGRRRTIFALESLEGRTLMTATPDRAALGAVAAAGGVAIVPLSIQPGKFATPASGKILFDVAALPTTGSKLVPNTIRILDAAGKEVLPATTKTGANLSARIALKPGDYTVRVRGLNNTTGGVVVTARMTGDVDGNHKVDAADLAAVQAALGSKKAGAGVAAKESANYRAALDLTRDGLVDAKDTALLKTNLGAATSKVKLLVQLTPDAAKTLGNGAMYVAYTLAAPNGQYEYLDKYGIVHLAKGTDNTVQIGASKYAVYSNALGDPLLAGGIDVDADLAMNSARAWLSASKPVYFQVQTTDGKPDSPYSGFVQPSVTNTSDPNYNTVFDIQEFNLAGGTLTGNVTQVDGFSIPLTLQFASGSTATKTVGSLGYRDVVLAGLKTFLATTKFPADVAEALTAQGGLRAFSVKKLLNIPASALGYFDTAIDKLWTTYTSSAKALTLSTTKGSYSGWVTGDGVFTFTGPETVKIARPSSLDVFASTGSLALGNDEHGAIGAQISAAINRGVSGLASSSWQTVSGFYPAAGPANYYAQYWHNAGLGGLAYGFDYDDVGQQDTLISMAGATQLTITVQWDKPK